MVIRKIYPNTYRSSCVEDEWSDYMTFASMITSKILKHLEEKEQINLQIIEISKRAEDTLHELLDKERKDDENV